ncbi:MAG: hypothetical protein ACU0DK_16040 [Pseudooceanicola sp.]
MRDTPRLVMLTTAQYRTTFREMRRRAPRHGYRISLLSYEAAVRRRFLPAGAAILTDFERLSPGWLELAARLRVRITATGAPVLNDPARFLPRAAFLRRLHAAGLNRFTCHLPALGERPDRFPVFLRTMAAHRGVIGDLLHDGEAAEAALEAALEAGHTLSDLAFVEYADTRADEAGVYRKQSAYVIGDHVVPGPTVSERHWVAKDGTRGASSAEFYADELAALDAYPHEGLARRVRDLCGMGFGRLDFAADRAGAAVFEWNTNPYIRFPGRHPDPSRRRTEAEIERRLHTALRDFAETGAGAPPPDLRGVFGWRGRLRLSPKMP